VFGQCRGEAASVPRGTPLGAIEVARQANDEMIDALGHGELLQAAEQRRPVSTGQIWPRMSHQAELVGNSYADAYTAEIDGQSSHCRSYNPNGVGRPQIMRCIPR
jgi:hypothetical protein